MKFYTYGRPYNPSILLIPGTCCHHSMYDHVIDGLMESFYVIVVSFSGFDETEASTYISMRDEAEKIEDYVQILCQSHITCAYGSSLGGSLVAYLVQRHNIHIDHAIIGSSDMDHAGKLSARLQANIITPLLYSIIDRGKLPGWMMKINEMTIKKHPEDKAYRDMFTKLFMPEQLRGSMSKESIYNQFYSDLITPLEKGIDVLQTTIHVLYATKMGKKFEKRYRYYFAHPDIRAFDLYHEELLICHPDKWVKEIRDCCGI